MSVHNMLPTQAFYQPERILYKAINLNLVSSIWRILHFFKKYQTLFADIWIMRNVPRETSGLKAGGNVPRETSGPQSKG